MGGHKWMGKKTTREILCSASLLCAMPEAKPRRGQN